MKILYVTTIGITMTFFKQLIKDLLEEGHTVDIICNEDDEKVPDCYREWDCKIYHHSCSRSPLAKGNLPAIGQIKKLVESQKYDIVHCHTPIAAMCTRLACKSLRKQGVKVMYTVHGFHFYEGAPLLNWLIYYPIEKICSYWTDVLIAINHEDFEFAKRKMKAKKIEYVPGVGIDIAKFRNTAVDRAAKRKELEIPEDAFLLVSVGELNINKNHEVIIRAVAELKNERVHYVIAGVGELEGYYKELSRQLGIRNQVHLLGYRKDIAEIEKVSDLFCFPSYREGLPVSVLEAMACGLPIVAARNRGTEECVDENRNIIISDLKNIKSYENAILLYMNDMTLRNSVGNENVNQVVNYDVKNVIEEMQQIYLRLAVDRNV